MDTAFCVTQGARDAALIHSLLSGVSVTEEAPSEVRQVNDEMLRRE